MLYERGSAVDCARGIVTYRDLESLAADVCGPSQCPLNEDELRGVFAECVPVADRGKNLDLLRASIWAECCGAWQAMGITI